MSASKIEFIGFMILILLWLPYYLVNGIRMIREKKMIYVFPLNLANWIAAVFIGRDRVVINLKKAYPDDGANYLGWKMLIGGGIMFLGFLCGIIMTFLDM